MPNLPGVSMGNTPDDTYGFIQTVIQKLPKNPDAFEKLVQDETIIVQWRTINRHFGIPFRSGRFVRRNRDRCR